MSASNSLLFTGVFFICIIISYSANDCDGVSNRCEVSTSVTRFIFYDVNPYEGFNLRRDVYMRIAILFNKLKSEGVNWKLILPSWNNLPHWRSVKAGSQSRLPWSLFFDLQSLQSYAPVVEMFEFFEDHPNVIFDHVITLQHYPNIWNDDFTWTEKWGIDHCQRPNNFKENADGFFKGSFSGYTILAKNASCVSFQGSASLLQKVIEELSGRFINFQHAETIIHDSYGGSDYWKCRASMKFSSDLISVANNFIKESLISFDAKKNNSVSLIDNPYLCVHLRRKDYLFSHPEQLPSIPFAVQQIKEKLKENQLNVVFVATDASDEEMREFSDNLLPYEVVRYIPPDDILRIFKDGGIAIIEQIICSRAKYFIGTYESTFSFRIQEERELLNFHPNHTFNRLCGDDEVDCKQPTRWLKQD